eukprot:TRINITY_DN6389_c0_g1_i3.p1 TRINITY_DN6389_c0_g1~~TRINITY_DN6389_c0_g1_i3.p1  ORF type:complete len:1025 (-),score=173.56 TRINITY_DN6389_c0_g1_i3:200-3274(-)
MNTQTEQHDSESSFTQVSYAAPVVKGRYISMSVVSLDASLVKKSSVSKRWLRSSPPIETVDASNSDESFQRPVHLLRRFMQAQIQRGALPLEWNLCFVDGEQETEYRCQMYLKNRKLFLTFMRMIAILCFFMVGFNVNEGNYVASVLTVIPILCFPVHLQYLRNTEEAATLYRHTLNMTFVIYWMIILVSRLIASDQSSSFLLILCLVIFLPILKALFPDAIGLVVIALISTTIVSSMYTSEMRLMRIIFPMVLLSFCLLFTCYMLERSDRRIYSIQKEVQAYAQSHREERQRTIHLLTSLYPRPVAKWLLDNRSTSFPTHFSRNAAVLMVDVVRFAEIASALDPQEMIVFISRVFSICDDLCDKYGVEKVKSVGTCYVAVAGLFENQKGDVFSLCCIAQELMQRVTALDTEFLLEEKIDLRVGIHQGTCHGFVPDCSKNAFDVIGEAPSLAWKLMRMASRGEILVSEVVRESVKVHIDFRPYASEASPVSAVYYMQPFTLPSLASNSDSGQDINDSTDQVDLTTFSFFDSSRPRMPWWLRNVFRMSDYRYKWLYKGLKFSDPQDEEMFWKSFHSRERFIMSLYYSGLYLLSCTIWGLFEIQYSFECDIVGTNLSWAILIRYAVVLPVSIFLFTAQCLSSHPKDFGYTWLLNPHYYVMASMILYMIYLVLKTAFTFMAPDNECMEYTVTTYSISELLFFIVFVTVSPNISLKGCTYITFPIVMVMFFGILLFGEKMNISSMLSRILFSFPFAILCYFGILKSSYSKEKLARHEYLSQKSQSNAISKTELDHNYALRILQSTIPYHLMERLQSGSLVTWTLCSQACILVVDVCGMQSIVSRHGTVHLLSFLSFYFTMLDQLCAQFQVEPIKTAGDTYFAMATAGGNITDVVDRVCRLALQIQEFMHIHQFPMISERVYVRIGVSIGSAVGGILGQGKFCYDVWGDTVRDAWNLQRSSHPGQVQISHMVWDIIKGMNQYTVECVRPESCSSDAAPKLYLSAAGDVWGVFTGYADWIKDNEEDGVQV